MDYTFWFANWFSFLLSALVLFIALLNMDNLGAFKSVAIKFSFLLVAASFLVCAYTFITRERIGATCEDGWQSSSTGSGTCSHHGGVDEWKYTYWFEEGQ